MLKVDNPMDFQSLVKRSLQYVASSILEEVRLGKFGQLLLRNQGNHQIFFESSPLTTICYIYVF
jgi:hypothetical protein